MAIVVTCRCGREWEPPAEAIRAGHWRDGCPRCRSALSALVCAGCGRALKSGKHRGACPGRRGRRRTRGSG